MTVTTSAANKVFELISEENNLNLKLRVFITGGGCSGFQYGFAFEENINSDDVVIQATAKPTEPDETIVYFLIDPMSYQYLLGAEIDYVEDIEGERFIIRNPNAQTTCGCGSSFSI
ncbi:MAG: iron-sulfur cluster insertion protein ErpA [Gammaproteobacteria bacterium]